MEIYLILFTCTTLFFLFLIFYEKYRFKNLTSNSYRIVFIEDDLKNKKLIKVIVQGNDVKLSKSVVLVRDKKYIIGEKVFLYSKIKNGKEVLTSKPNYKSVVLHLFFVWLACIIMLILVYFGSSS